MIAVGTRVRVRSQHWLVPNALATVVAIDNEDARRSNRIQLTLDKPYIRNAPDGECRTLHVSERDVEIVEPLEGTVKP
jgi:hypothetical protein